jgi:hypothetical protein
MDEGRVSAPRSEGVGLELPKRNPAHADPEWYQRDLDEEIEDPDEPWLDPLPTERHRSIPE